MTITEPPRGELATLRRTLTTSFVLLLGVYLGSAVEAGAATASAKTASGKAATVSVMASGGELLDAWIDFDGNGTWTDPGEHVFQNQLLLKDMNRLTFRVPLDAPDGGMLALFRLAGREFGGSPLDVVVPFFRDVLPGPYPIDGGPDGRPSVAGLEGGVRPGVKFPSAVEAGNIAAVEVAFGRRLVNAWIDFNGNGLWTDPGEQILENQLLAREESRLTFRVPVDAAEGGTWARFRFHSRGPSQTGGSLSLEGPAPNDGVEDYRLDIVVPFFRDGFESRDVSAWSKGPGD